MAKMTQEGETKLSNALNELSDDEIKDFKKLVGDSGKADPGVKEVVEHEDALRTAIIRIKQEDKDEGKA